MKSGPTKITNKMWILALYLFFFLLFGNWVILYDQDEAAYFGFAKTMWEKGDWVVPDYPFSEPHRKTPLHFWTGALSFAVFGVSEFAFRLPTVLATIGSFFLTFRIAQILFNERVAFLALLVLSTSFYFPLTGKIGLVDASLTFSELLGFLALVRLYNNPRIILWKVVFYLALSIGILIKGPPILIFLGGIVFVCLLRPEHRFLVFSLQPWFWGWVSLLPLLVWGRLAWLETNGEFVKWLIDWYILRRAANPVFGQSGPPGAYFLLFFIGLFPWSYYFLVKWKSLVAYFKREFIELVQKDLTPSPNKLLFYGLIFGWFFYEPLLSKLPSYTLAAYPLVSILLASQIQETKLPKPFLAIVFTFQIGVLILGTVVLEPYRLDSKLVANAWNSAFPENTVAYHIEDFALPSLAVYSHLDWKKLKSYEEIQNLSEKSLVILSDKQFFLVPKTWNKKGETMPIFLYDRNRTIYLQAFETSR